MKNINSHKYEFELLKSSNRLLRVFKKRFFKVEAWGRRKLIEPLCLPLGVCEAKLYEMGVCTQ